MRSHLVTLTVLATALFAATACSKKGNPRMQAPPEQHKVVDQVAPRVESTGDPKVNILFVVDNSQSMDAHQTKLKQNIDRFADKFFHNPRIDFKIGIVPVYDSKYLNDSKQDYTYNETINGKRVTKVGPRIMVQNNGVLVPLKDANGQVITGAPFITRDTLDAKNVLKNTVAIGTQWGPEAEESFSPVLKIISDDNLNNSVNAGFYEKDAFLVVIFLTDADDVTPGENAYEFYEKLKAAKGGNENKILIAAALPSSKVDKLSCRLDGSGPQSRFPDLMNIAQGTVADLCSNSFGDDLAELGERLVNQVGSQRIPIQFIPDSNSIQVSYGNPANTERQIIPRDQTGWSYNIENQEIVLSPELNIKRVPGGEIFVKYTEVNLNNIQNGRLVPASQVPPASTKAKE
ncbi:MAG: hypothetical protein V4596_08925 [Bdellovibrionota bacterium]